MPSTDPTAVIILSEIVALETSLIFGAVIYFFIRKRKLINQINNSLSNYKKNIPERSSLLKSIYSQSPQLEEREVDNLVNDLVNNEATFYRSIMSSLNNFSLASISTLEKDIHALVSPYMIINISEKASDKNDVEKKSIVPDIDSAIDDLLSDDADDAEGDPALDLSSVTNTDGDIEEIPEELLSGISDDNDEKNQDSSADDQNNNQSSSDNKQNKII